MYFMSFGGIFVGCKMALLVRRIVWKRNNELLGNSAVVTARGNPGLNVIHLLVFNRGIFD